MLEKSIKLNIRITVDVNKQSPYNDDIFYLNNKPCDSIEDDERSDTDEYSSKCSEQDDIKNKR